MNVPVSREVPNTVVLNQISLYFRQWPATARGGADGAIPEVDYVLRSGDSRVTGQTDSEGKIVVNIPAGETARLEIFGTTYEITRLTALETINTIQGAQRRLNILGYRAGPVDGDQGPKTDHSLLCFQGDHNMSILGFVSPGGAVGTATRDNLQTIVGE
jgi:hypothetical protein